jgi:hypothetical protein
MAKTEEDYFFQKVYLKNMLFSNEKHVSVDSVSMICKILYYIAYLNESLVCLIRKNFQYTGRFNPCPFQSFGNTLSGVESSDDIFSLASP